MVFSCLWQTGWKSVWFVLSAKERYHRLFLLTFSIVIYYTLQLYTVNNIIHGFFSLRDQFKNIITPKTYSLFCYACLVDPL